MPRIKSERDIRLEANSSGTVFHPFQLDTPIIEPIIVNIRLTQNECISPSPLQSLVIKENGFLVGDYKGEIHVYQKT